MQPGGAVDGMDLGGEGSMDIGSLLGNVAGGALLALLAR